MITLSVIFWIAVLCIGFAVLADVLCFFLNVATGIVAVPLAIVGALACLALFSGAALTVGLPFVLLGVGLGSGLARKQRAA